MRLVDGDLAFVTEIQESLLRVYVGLHKERTLAQHTRDKHHHKEVRDLPRYLCGSPACSVHSRAYEAPIKANQSMRLLYVTSENSEADQTN